MPERREDKQLQAIVDAFEAGHTPGEESPDLSERNLVIRLAEMRALSNYPTFLFGIEARKQGIMLGIRYALGEDVPIVEELIGKLFSDKHS